MRCDNLFIIEGDAFEARSIVGSVFFIGSSTIPGLTYFGARRILLAGDSFYLDCNEYVTYASL